MMRAGLQEPDWAKAPSYPVFSEFTGVKGLFTGKGVDAENGYFSFHRPGSTDDGTRRAAFLANIQHLGRANRFDPGRVTMPNGAWPHSGRAIKAEAHRWVRSPRIGVVTPVTADGGPITYDAIATASAEFVLAVQGADCPAVFLCDPGARVIGLAHAGWKPLVRGVVANAVGAMAELGADPKAISAFVSPGSGDRYTVFRWDGDMEEEVRSVFVQAGRADLLADPSLRHVMTAEERAALAAALGRDVAPGSSTFRIMDLAVRDLRSCGVPEGNISRSRHSGLVERYPQKASAGEKHGQAPFRYHSYRRERPTHGLSISLLYLQDHQAE